jgi:tetratricopeptide (TPR) repeat protein
MPSFLNIFSHLKFKQSIRYYSNFNRSDRKNLVLNLNRSNEFLREKIFNLAFKNAQQAALIDINNEKAYFIMGKCAYNMRQFNKAKILKSA